MLVLEDRELDEEVELDTTAEEDKVELVVAAETTEGEDVARL